VERWRTSVLPEYKRSVGYSAISRYREAGADYLVNLVFEGFVEEHKEYMKDLEKNCELIEKTGNYIIYKL